ncbi:ABC transporter permease [Clostridium aestuarii]|uniref:ABC transporter permease n=1 Tax=Clostridium aestuarii TaxID=338193 RepID=A0ABT4D344_9CLOT|nr:ABC transporter permease [Clostridium aestuarii]
MFKYINEFIKDNKQEFWKAVSIHLKISFLALLIGSLIGIALAIFIYKHKKFSALILSISSFIRMIPSLVVLALVMPYLGIGFKPAVMALLILGIPPILINTYEGFKKIDPIVIEAAKGMGMDSKSMFWKIEFPLAMKVAIQGIKTAAVEIIASATLAAVIGGGGLGDFILTGLSIADTKLLVIGAVPVSVLAFLTSFVFSRIEKRFLF